MLTVPEPIDPIEAPAKRTSNTVQEACAPIIEILGIPGAGKSTLYSALVQQHRKSMPWTHQHCLLSAAIPSWSKPASRVSYLLRSMTGSRLPQMHDINSGIQFCQRNREFAELASQLLQTHPHLRSDPGARFRASYLLYQDFCRYELISRTFTNQLCLIDEGLHQKSFLLPVTEETTNNLIDQYLDLSPAPAAAVVVDVTNKDILINRLRSRSKVIASHLGMSTEKLQENLDQWRHYLGVATERLRRKGTRLILIDGSAPLSDNLEQLRGALETV